VKEKNNFNSEFESSGATLASGTNASQTWKLSTVKSTSSQDFRLVLEFSILWKKRLLFMTK